MNSSSKVPPRFVPTLTEVVQIEPSGESESIETQAVDANSEEAAFVPEQQPSATPDESPSGSFHSPWLADGLYARRGAASIPQDLPPLPESLPPQQPFARTDMAEDEASEAGSAHIDVAQEPKKTSESDEITELMVEAPPEASEVLEQTEQLVDSAQADENLQWKEQAPQVTEEYLVHRLMQRVDLVLDQRLKEAISLVVQEQTRSMVLRLREEVETVVRQAVYEAVEDELALQVRGKPPESS